MRLDYPGGDVAADRGVCADVVVRALRALDIDLQQLVHEDMKRAFAAYPDHWGLTRPDRNIDHRRVPNLEAYLSRAGAKLRPSDNPADYAPGDIVAWNLKGDAGWLPHIGIVTDRIAPSGRPLIVHNIGAGPKLEDVLFSWRMTGAIALLIECNFNYENPSVVRISLALCPLSRIAFRVTDLSPFRQSPSAVIGDHLWL